MRDICLDTSALRIERERVEISRRVESLSDTSVMQPCDSPCSGLSSRDLGFLCRDFVELRGLILSHNLWEHCDSSDLQVASLGMVLFVFTACWWLLSKVLSLEQLGSFF